MGENHTTAVVQRYLDALAEETPADPLIRALLDRAVGRLEMLCGSMLFRSYRRLTRPPLGLRTNELLGAVVERLLRALRAVRPRTARAFFALVNRHITWELNDLARRLVVRFTNNVVVSQFLYPTQQKLLESAATRVLASSACLVE
jgi:hypothetical protein